MRGCLDYDLTVPLRKGFGSQLWQLALTRLGPSSMRYGKQPIDGRRSPMPSNSKDFLKTKRELIPYQLYVGQAARRKDHSRVKGRCYKNSTYARLGR